MTVATANAIIESLEQVAESTGDITELVFSAYFDRCPASRELMSHTDRHMRGRMMDQVLLLLMEEGEEELRSYIDFETRNHKTYGVQAYMYENLFTAVLETVSDCLGADFSSRHRAAWDARIGRLLGAINAAG